MVYYVFLFLRFIYYVQTMTEIYYVQNVGKSQSIQSSDRDDHDAEMVIETSGCGRVFAVSP
jgi:hypothetical protein